MTVCLNYDTEMLRSLKALYKYREREAGGGGGGGGILSASAVKLSLRITPLSTIADKSSHKTSLLTTAVKCCCRLPDVESIPHGHLIKPVGPVT